MTAKVATGVSKLFIANRGEIARRIAMTAGRMGIPTVAICQGRHPPQYLQGVLSEFYPVEEENTALYLDADKMIAAAKESGCDSLHPGFGFLSENDRFADQVTASGLNWVGPSSQAIAAMASKAKARDLAVKAGVPVLQGLQGFSVPEDDGGDFSELETFAAKVGYPLLMKAAFGGGGKGMRIVRREAELKPSALRAFSEAKSSFGDGTLICEQYLDNPRHVEVQIVADRHGNVVAVGDRDCSVQRRHQKIIEEAPAPHISADVRSEMHRAAVNLAAEVGYNNAGTVEYLLTTKADGSQQFYFLEMNTRLQVEHTVTEEVFDQDLVEWQLRIARGEALPADWQPMPRGHSFEVRLYGEDPEQNFLPTPGPVPLFRPAYGPGVRWEVGLDSPGEITGKFDPMFAKLVVTGPNRVSALDRLAQCLLQTGFCGSTTNIPLLHYIVTATNFRDGPEGTHFLTDYQKQLAKGLSAAKEAAASVADEVFADLAAETGSTAEPANDRRPALQAAAFGSNPLKSKDNADFSGIRQPLGRQTFQGGQLSTGRGLHSAAGKATHFWYARWQSSEDLKIWCQVDGWSFSRQKALRRRWDGQTSAASGGNAITAPVPGKVVQVKVEPDTAVETDQTLFILESMKMEFEVKAQAKGVIGEVKVKAGDQVAAGDGLAVLQDDDHEN